jgi:hypothetical protein
VPVLRKPEQRDLRAGALLGTVDPDALTLILELDRPFGEGQDRAMTEARRWLRAVVVGLSVVAVLGVGSMCRAQDMELAPPPTSDLESLPPPEYGPPAADYQQAQPVIEQPPPADFEAAQPEYDSGQDTE